MLYSLLFYLVFITLAVKGNSITLNDCPSAITRDNTLKVFNDKCYKFELKETLSFSSAQKKCKLNGGNLAMIKSKEENDFLVNQLKNTYGKSSTMVWIGVYYKILEDAYYYVDGTPMTSYNKLDSTQNHECVYIAAGINSWNDIRCIYELFYICEYSAMPPFLVDHCPAALSRNNLHVFENNCYVFHVNSTLNFTSAQQYCQQNRGNLALVKNHADDIFLMNVIKTHYKELSNFGFMIGLRYNTSRNSYQWVDGSSLVYNKLFHFEERKQLKCISLVSSWHTWSDDDCDYKYTHSFICQYPLKEGLTVENCPKGVPRNDQLKIFEEKCYSFETDKKMSFTEAEEFCEHQEGHLVMVKSQSVNEFIFHELNENIWTNVWIGMIYNKSAKIQHWIDGSSVSYSDFSSYKTDNETAQNCAVMNPLDGSWELSKCNFIDNSYYTKDSNLPFVCQYEPAPYEHYPPRTTPFSPTSMSKQDCPVMAADDKNIQVLDNKCYYFDTNSLLTFTDAKIFCQTHGWTVALVKTKQINNFLVNHLIYTYKQFGFFWIGLQYNIKYGHFEWLDGSQIIFSDFGRISRLVNGNVILDLKYNIGKWHDIDSNSLMKFICEFDKGKPQTTTSTTNKLQTTTIPTTTIVPISISKQGCPEMTDDDNNNQVLDNKCYYFNTISLFTFTDAKIFCQTHGGSLALVKTKRINDFLVDHLVHTYKQTDFFWIGLQYNIQDGHFEWLDGSPMKFSKFAPSSLLVNGNVLLDLKINIGEWHGIDSNSWKSLKFICEFNQQQPQITLFTTNKLQTTTIPTTTSSEKQDCNINVENDRFVQVFDDKCYVFNTTTRWSSDKARNYCDYFGGHLAIAKNKETNDFLRKHLEFTYKQKGVFWIGIRYNFVVDNFAWMDDSPLTYTNFRKETPHLNCVALDTKDGKWVDKSCATEFFTEVRLPFICQFPKRNGCCSINLTPW